MKKKLLTLALIPIFVFNTFGANMSVLADELGSEDIPAVTDNVDDSGTTDEPSSDTPTGDGDSTDDLSGGDSEETPTSLDDDDPLAQTEDNDGTVADDGTTDGTTDGVTDVTTTDGATTDGTTPDGTDGSTADGTIPDDDGTVDPLTDLDTEMDILGLNGVEEPMGSTFIEGDAICGEDAYAILYDDGLLVIQKGTDEESENIVATYALDAENCPWNTYDGDGNAVNITSVVFRNRLVGRTSLSGFFYNCQFSEIDVSMLDTSTVTNAGGCFVGCTQLTSIDLSSWDTSNMTSMGGIFSGDANLSTVNLDGLDFSSMSSGGIGGMFGGCTNITSVSAKNWTNLPTNLSSCWGRSWSLNSGSPSVDVSGWDVSNVTSFNGFFANSSVSSITGLDTWNTASLVDAYQCFYGMNNLTSLDISSWDFSNVVDSGMIFSEGITTISLPDSFQYVGGSVGNFPTACLRNTAWTSDGVKHYSSTDMINSFAGGGTYYQDGALVGVDTIYSVLYADGTLVVQADDIPQTDIYGPVYSVWGNPGIREVPVGACIGTSGYYQPKGNVNTIIFRDYFVGATTVRSGSDGMFRGFNNLTSIVDFYKYDTSKVTDFTWLFGNQYGSNCPLLQSVDFSQCDFSSATNMTGMFGYMPGLTTAILPDNTGNVTSMESMFYNDANLTSVTITNTSSVTTMYQMFRDCPSLDAPDMSTWDVSKCTKFNYMFYNDTSLETIDISSWNMPVNSNTQSMLGNCTNLHKVTVGTGFHTTISLNNSSNKDFYTTNITGTWYNVTNPSYRLTLYGLLSNSYSAQYAGTWVFVDEVITFHPQGGTASFTELSITSDTTDFTFPTATRDGYTFLGWFDSDNNLVEEYSPDLTVTDLYAHWEASESYTLIIDSNRDDLDDVEVVLALDEYYILADAFASDDDYILTGFNTKADGTGTNYTKNDGIVGAGADGETITIYAQWKPIEDITITVHYVSALDGSEISTEEYEAQTGARFSEFYDDGYNKRFDDGSVVYFWSFLDWLDEEHAGAYYVAQYGYTYDYWSYNYDSNNQYQLIHEYNTIFDEDCDIYAYVIPPASITLYWDNTFITEQYDIDAFQLTLDGENWYDSGELTIVIPFNKSNNKANFTHNAFSTSFSVQMGPDNLCYTSSSLSNLVPNYYNTFNISPEGYFGYIYSDIFAVPNPIDPTTGSLIWSQVIGRCSRNWENNHYTYEYDYRVPYGSNMAGYLLFEPIIYYDYGCTVDNGSTGSTSLSIPGSGYSADITQSQISYFPSPARTGYNLVGWVDADGNEITTTSVIDLTTNNTLYAVWEENGDPIDDPDNPIVIDPDTTVTITFDSQGGTEFEPLVVPYGQYTGLAAYVPEKEDWVFTGWYDEETGKYYSTSSAVRFTQDMTLTAHWSQNGTIYFDITGYTNAFTARGSGKAFGTETIDGYTYRTYTILDGATFGYLPGMNVAGQHFIGWYDEEGNQLTSDTVPAIGTIYHPEFEPTTATVDENGIEFECAAYWNNYDDGYVDNTHLYFSNGSLHHVAQLHLHFGILENSNTIPAGNIQIVIPKYVFPSNTNNLASDLPQYPNTSSEIFFSYKSYDNDSWAIINSANLTNSSAGLDFDISYNTQYQSYGLNREFPVIFMVDTDNDGEFDVSKEYTLYMRVANKRPNTWNNGYGRGTAYTVWQNAWGEAPADADQYFYVMWNYTVSLNSPDEATSSVYMYPMDDSDGELIGCGSSGHASYQWLSFQSYSNKFYMLYRYPISMLDADSGRVTVNNSGKFLMNGEEHIVNASSVNYQYVELTRDEANFTLGIVSSYGRFNPLKYSQNALLNGTSVSGLEWSCRYQNTAPWTSTVDENGVVTTEWLPYDINLSMGVGDVYLSSGAGDDYNMWNPACGNIMLGEGDYSFEKLYITMWNWDTTPTTNANTAWTVKQKVNCYLPYEIWVRRTGDNDLLLYQSGTWYANGSSQTITLPANTVEWKVVVNTNGHYYDRVYVNPFVTLNPTARVISQVQPDFNIGATTAIKLGAHCDLEFGDVYPAQNLVINHTMEDQNALLDIYELQQLPDSDLNLECSVMSGSTVNNATQQTSSIYCYVGARNYHANENTPSTPLVSGIFYILLPENSPNPQNIVLYGSNDNANVWSSNGTRRQINSNFYNYEYVNNWEGTGRTMLIVSFDDVDYSQVWVGVSTMRTYRDCAVLGNRAYLSAMFVGTTDMPAPYKTINYSYGSMSETHKYAYESVYEDYSLDNYIATSSYYLWYYQATLTSWGLFGSVARSDNNYVSNVSVIPGEEYSHKILYAQDKETITTNLLIQDTLDGVGTLQGITVPTISGYTLNGTATTSTGTVWYCTSENPDFDNLDADHGWTQTMPVGEQVYGLVVDYRTDVNGNQFVLGNGTASQAFTITIYEKANAILDEISTNNTATMFRDIRSKTDTTFTTESPSSTISNLTLHMPEIIVNLTSDPISGTELEPQPVEPNDALTYTLTVDNRENATLEDVIVTDTLPDGVTINEADIKINGNPIANYPDITYTITGNTITFNFDEIKGVNSNKHSYSITIPCTVSTTIPDTLIINQGQVVGFNGIDLPDEHKFNSNETYHILQTIIVPEPTGFSDNSVNISVILICIAMAFMFKLLLFGRKREENQE